MSASSTRQDSSPASLLRRRLDRRRVGGPALAVLLAASPATAAESVSRRVMAMGTMLEVSATAETRDAAVAAGERAIRAVAAVEERLSTWRTNSELAALNAAPAGRPVPLSPELAADLAVAASWWRATGGAFDPGVGALVAAWGLRDGGRRPGSADLAAAMAGSGLAHLELEGRTAVRRCPGLVIDEGGFGKGIALDAALRAAAAASRVVLDFGGQVAVSDGPALAVAIAHPDRRGEVAATCELKRGSIATSGASERGVMVGGARLGHVLDPRSGAPAPDFGSLSVWAPSAAAADCLSTGLYVMGPQGALEWARAHPEIGVLVLERTPAGVRARASAGWPSQRGPSERR